MTAVYSPEGVFLYDDGQPSMDQMQYELMQKKPETQKERPLDSAINAFKHVTTTMNPLMLMKAGIAGMADVPRVAASAVAPMAAPIVHGPANAIEYASKMPGVLYRENVLKDPQSMQEAANIRSKLTPVYQPPNTPYDPEGLNQRMESFGQAVAPQTEVGQTALEQLGKAFSGLPPVGPGSGMPGTSKLSPRPFITPNDVRVLGAKGVHAVREASQIPSDIANVRESGIQRMSPVTGEPSVGSRIGKAIDPALEAADQYSQWRAENMKQAELEKPFWTSQRGAIRQPGSFVVNPTVPESMPLASVKSTGTYNVLANKIPLSTIDEPTYTEVNDEYKKTYFNGTEVTELFNDYENARIEETLKEAGLDIQDADSTDRLKIMELRAGREWPKLRRQFLEEFASQNGLPTFEEFADRVKLAREAVSDVVLPYVTKFVGTADDPALKLARQGKTYVDPDESLNRSPMPSSAAVMYDREKAGFSREGEFADEYKQADERVTKAATVYRQMSLLETAAMNQAVADGFGHNQPRGPLQQDPRVAEARRNRDQSAKELDKTTKDLENITLARNYEASADTMMSPITATSAYKNIALPSRQFFPELRQLVQDDPIAKVYIARSGNAFNDTGIEQITESMINDILVGTLTRDQVLQKPFESYIQKHVNTREEKRALEKKDLAKRLTAIETNLKDIVTRNKRPGLKFTNSTVLEMDSNMPADDIRLGMSQDSYILDHCIGDVGLKSATKDTKHWFGPNKGRNRNNMPMLDIATGERTRPGATDTSYMKQSMTGKEINASFRDNVTYFPMANVQLKKQSGGEYTFGFVSGFQNKNAIGKEYINDIKDYLNKKDKEISITPNGSDSPVSDKIGVYDIVGLIKFKDNIPGVSLDQIKAIAQTYPDINRFLTAKEIKDLATPMTEPAVAEVSQPSVEPSVIATRGVIAISGRIPANTFMRDVYNEVVRDARQSTTQLGIETSPATYILSIRNDLDQRIQEIERISPRNLVHEGFENSEHRDNSVRGLLHALNDLDTLHDEVHDAATRQQEQPPAQQARVADPDLARVALDYAIETIEDDQGVRFADQIREIRNAISEHFDPADELEEYVHQLRRKALSDDTSPELRDALNYVADELDSVGVPQELDEVGQLFEPDEAHGANQPQALPIDEIVNILWETETTNGVPDIPAIESTIQALRNGELDHPDIRANALPADRPQLNAELADLLEGELNEYRAMHTGPNVPGQPNVAPYRPVPADITRMDEQALWQNVHGRDETNVQQVFDEITDVTSPEEVENIVGLVRSHLMSEWADFTDMQREWLARCLEQYIQDNTPPPDEPPQRRGPFRPGGASAVRGVPLGNLNIQPAIRAESFRGPDSQPVGNFLQQVKSMPGVTQEGLKTGLMAFENMDPSRQITKAEFVRELLPSSYDIVDLANSSARNEHDLEYLDDHLDDDDVIDRFKETYAIPENLYDDISADTQYEDLSVKLKKYLAKKGIRNEEEFSTAIVEVRRELVEAEYENYMAENHPGEDTTGDPYRYRITQRLALDSIGDEYSEFGVTHPDQTGSYGHYPQAPEGVIGHVRATYNPDGLEVKTTDADIFTTKPNSYVIEEIQSDAQKNSQQVAHLHQVHGVLFKAAIQKALELGADTVYLPTAKMIAAERPSVEGWEARPDDRGLTMQVPIRKDTTSKFKPIYDQAIVKEGLKPLLKIPGVTSKLVSNGDYHEISFTPEAKEYILNGPGQTIPGYKDGGSVKSDAAFGMYPGMGKRSKKSDIGDKLNASLIPQDALDLALTVMPFGKAGKALAAGILASDPAEAQAGNMSALLKLVAKEAPEQFQSIRNALIKSFKTGLEHSVVGSTHTGRPSGVTVGNREEVMPNAFDVSNARQRLKQSSLIDFHTHPAGVSEFTVNPSSSDLNSWNNSYITPRGGMSNEVKTLIASPPNREDRLMSGYNFFATDKPTQTLNPGMYDVARYELQKSKPFQALKDNPTIAQYIDNEYGDMGNILESATPLLLQKHYAQKGLGRHELKLSNEPVGMPWSSITNNDLFEPLVRPAMEVLESKKFAKGGTVRTIPDVDQMKFELTMRRE